jgi:ligand-binding sensor domain-containing protein
MTQSPLARQPIHHLPQNTLRELFKQYLQAEDEATPISWETITTREGLPHNWIYDLFQDSRRRIWVGTWGGGLAVYTAGNWRTFTTKNGLHSNEVTCIREDSAGRVWIATDNGLNMMEGDHIVDAGLYGKSLLNITFDQTGALWAGCWRAVRSGGGLFRFDGNAWKAFSTLDNLPGLEILKVFTDSQDRIWIGTYEQNIGAGVGCYDGHHWRKFTSVDGLANDCVYSMFEDPSGNMWFGTIGGVSIFDGKTWHNLNVKDGLVDNRVYCMMIDSHKKMWFGTESGVSQFDSQKWTTYTQNDGLVENLVRTIIETYEGELWFGTYPYSKGLGGISIARYAPPKSLPDRVIELLPEPPKLKQLPHSSDG